MSVVCLFMMSALSLRSLLVIASEVKKNIAVNGTPSHSYGVSVAIRDHTVLPVIRHK